jgi:hypothetical protein
MILPIDSLQCLRLILGGFGGGGIIGKSDLSLQIASALLSEKW